MKKILYALLILHFCSSLMSSQRQNQDDGNFYKTLAYTGMIAGFATTVFASVAQTGDLDENDRGACAFAAVVTSVICAGSCGFYGYIKGIERVHVNYFQQNEAAIANNLRNGNNENLV